MGDLFRMRSRALFLVILVLLTIGASVAIGISKKIQVYELLNASSEISYASPNESYFVSDSQVYNLTIHNYQDLYNSSEEVLLVTAGPAIQNRGIFENTVTISSVYKSTHGLNAGDSLVIFEPIRLRSNRVSISFSYVPMVESNQYIVFLSHVDTFGNMHVFNFVTPLFGKIPVKDRITIQEYDFIEGQEFKYDNLTSTDLIILNLSEIIKQIEAQVIIDPQNPYLQTELQNTLLFHNDQASIKEVIEVVYKKLLNRDVFFN